MKLAVALSFALIASPAFAQQQLSPAEAALQIGSIATGLAQFAAQQGRMIEELQKQIVAKDARIRELEVKIEPKKE